MIPHEVIMNIVSKDIACDRFLSLIRQALKVGYIDPKTGRVMMSKIGTPQGSVLSPLLANIVLHELDLYLTKELLPENNKGRRRRTNPEYNKIAYTKSKSRHPLNKKSTPPSARGARIEDKAIALERLRITPRMDTLDPGYRRSMYIRYADDFVILFEGPKSEALNIRDKVKDFLHNNVGLDLNMEKTIVSHMNEGFNFLGAYIKTLKNVDFRMKTKTTNGTPITMRANVRARVNMPTKNLIAKFNKAGFVRNDAYGKVVAKPMTSMVNLDHATIIQFFNSKINGLVNYYTFANRIETQNLI